LRKQTNKSKAVVHSPDEKERFIMAKTKNAVAVLDVAAVADAPVAEVATAKRRGKAVDPNSKQSRGRALFQKMHTGATPVRGEVIKALQTEIGLTKAGAATYYQNFKAEAGLVVHKAKSE
jgi:hypothetical protein